MTSIRNRITDVRPWLLVLLIVLNLNINITLGEQSVPQVYVEIRAAITVGVDTPTKANITGECKDAKAESGEQDSQELSGPETSAGSGDG